MQQCGTCRVACMWNKPDRGRQIVHGVTYVWNLFKKMVVSSHREVGIRVQTLSYKFWGSVQEVFERAWLLVDAQAGPRNSGARHLVHTIPTQEAVARTKPWESKMLLRSSGLNTWVNPGKASRITFEGSGRQVQRSVYRGLPQTASCASARAYKSCHLAIRSGLTLSCFMSYFIFT